MFQLNYLHRLLITWLLSITISILIGFITSQHYLLTQIKPKIQQISDINPCYKSVNKAPS